MILQQHGKTLSLNWLTASVSGLDFCGMTETAVQIFKKRCAEDYC